MTRHDRHEGRSSWLLLVILLSGACRSTAPAASPSEPPEVALTGPLTRAELEESLPLWVEAQMVASLHTEEAHELAQVEAGARVRVFLGTWCSDSRREVSTLWRVLDENMGIVPFEVEYFGVDRKMLRSEDLVQGLDLDFVPTIVVERDAIEIGRIVESAPHGIDRDLLALLEGRAHGVISGRPELFREEEGAPQN